MSLTSFEVALRPDSRLHWVVLCTGFACIVIGVILIGLMPISIHWRVLVIAMWSADGAHELWSLDKGAGYVRLIVLDSDGGIACISDAGDTVPATLLSGSFVSSNLAWLRLRLDRRLVYAGLFVRKSLSASDWHRLQLIWQQSRAAFGHPARP